MVNPVIYTLHIFGYDFPLYWYGVIVMLGAVVGTWLAEKEIARRGENGETIWDALVWVLPIGIIGARIWFVVNATLGGNDFYMQKPLEIFNIRGGGLHIFGGFLFGGIALLSYLRKNRMDIWLFLDAIAPATLLGQAVARPANFINQELYGPPTKLMWGIPISAEHRLPAFPISEFPFETTRFHPTFAYEMILNVIIVLFLLWLGRRYAASLKPGAIFGSWLVLAGLSRAFIEFFRPDQPRIAGTFVTTSMLMSLVMSISGAVFLLIRFGKLQPEFAQDWEEKYRLADQNPKPKEKAAKVSPALPAAAANKPKPTRTTLAKGGKAKKAAKKSTPPARTKPKPKKPMVKRKS